MAAGINSNISNATDYDMKKTLYTISASLLTGLLLLCSCNRTKEYPDPTFNTDEVALSVEGETIFECDEVYTQKGQSSDNEFYVANDELGTWYSVSLNTLPTAEGEEVSGKVVWRLDHDSASSKRENVVFTVKGLDSSTGEIKLWSKGSGIWAIVYNVL